MVDAFVKLARPAGVQPTNGAYMSAPVPTCIGPRSRSACHSCFSTVADYAFNALEFLSMKQALTLGGAGVTSRSPRPNV
jgi:hypothetical protein